MFKTIFFHKVFIIVFLSTPLLGCFNLNTLSISLPSMGSDFAPSDSEWFYIDLDVDTYENANEDVPYYEVGTTEEWGDSYTRNSPSNCELEYLPEEDGDSKNASQTIICIMDLMEGDVTAKDLHLIYNIPEGMCEYYSVKLPWHFNFEILPGPIVRECEMPSSGDEEGGQGYCNDTNNNGCEDSEPCREDKEELCVSGSGEPKCCYGGDKGDDEDWVPEPECFGGPIMSTTNSDLQGVDNIGFRHIHSLPEGGVKGKVSIGKLVDLKSDKNVSIHFANYLKALDVPPDDLSSVRISELPAFLQPAATDIGFPTHPELFFEFRCMDSAEEVVHEILLMIREWNTYEEFIEFYDLAGSEEGDPDVEGMEGEDCSYENRPRVEGTSLPCNDMWDFEDFENAGNDYPKIKYGSGKDGSATTSE